MSLVSNLISGSTGNFGLIDPKKYGHDTGALRIATESAEALHDIFIEGFYNMEQAELAAVHEGVALESSQYQAVVEASVTSVFAKVKEFFKKLWEKVKAFFHSVKRYIDAIFMSGKEFVKKYDADIKKATNLKDFEYKMYDYDNELIDKVESIDVEETTNEILKELNPAFGDDIATTIDKLAVYDDGQVGAKNPNKDIPGSDAMKARFESESDDDQVAKIVAGKFGIKGVSEYSDFSNACFSHFRNGAEDKSDMDDIVISSLSEYVSILKSFNSSKLDKMMSNTDKAFKKAIGQVDKCEGLVNKKFAKGTNKTTFSKILSSYSSILSKAQSLSNTYYTAWKTAAKERDSAYKSMIVKAIAYSKKQGKKK